MSFIDVVCDLIESTPLPKLFMRDLEWCEDLNKELLGVDFLFPENTSTQNKKIIMH